jgi:hypothetical protein
MLIAIVTARYPAPAAETIRTQRREEYRAQCSATNVTKHHATGQSVVGRNHHCMIGESNSAAASATPVAGCLGRRVTTNTYANTNTASAGSHQRIAMP